MKWLSRARAIASGKNRKNQSSHRAASAAIFEAVEERILFSFFVASPTYNVGGDPAAATTADLRGIGKQDVIVGWDSANQVGVLLGNGDGTFQGMADYGVPNFPTALATGDVNGDGRTDVVVAEGNNILVLFGNGDGSLHYGPETDFTTTHSSLAIADFNGDGKADVVANNLLLIGNGDGTFQTPVTLGASVLGVATADVNGDGKTDILASALTTSTPGGLLNVPTLSEFLGNGDGTFQAPNNSPVIGSGVSSGKIVASDLNADGTIDIAILGNATNAPPGNGVAPTSSLNIFMGNGNGTFQPALSYSTGQSDDSMVAADLNSDGVNDLLIGTSNGDEDNVVYVVQGESHGAPATPFAYSPGTQNLASLAIAADFNGDGHTDFAAIDNVQGTGFMRVVLNNGDGTFGAPKGFASDPAGFIGVQPGLVPTAEGIVTGDFNHDGKLDLAVLNEKQTFDHVDIMLGNGDGTFQPAYEVASVLGQGARFITADINGDGNADLVVASADSTDVIYGNADGSFRAPVILNFAPQGLIANIGVGDYNGDGKADIIESAELTAADRIPSDFVFIANGDGSFQSVAPALATAAATAAFATPIYDFNSDGIADQVSSANGGTSILLGLGDQASVFGATFQTGALPLPAGRTPVSLGTVRDPIAVGDFNGDGTPDIAVGVFLSETVSIALNSPTWQYGLNGTTGLKIIPLAPVQAGQPATIEVEAVDANGNLNPNFQGIVSIDLPDPGSPFVQLADEYSFSPTDAGVHIFSNRIVVPDLGQTAITVRSLGLTPTSIPITVVAGPAAKFVVTQTNTAVAGTALSFTVSPEDKFGHLIPHYSGTIHFTSTDPAAILPADYTFTAADNGTHAFNAALTQVGSTITLTDIAIGGTTTFVPSLRAAAPVQLIFKPLDAFVTAGNPVTLTITAVDQFGNTAPSSGDPLVFSSSDPRAILPGTLLTNTGIVKAPIDFITTGTQSITVTDLNTGQTFTQSLTVSPNLTAALSVKGAASATAGGVYTVTVSMVDAFGNINPTTLGTLRFTSSDGRAVLPADYFVTSTDNGSVTFTVNFRSPGTQSLTVSYAPLQSLTTFVGTVSGVTVTPGPAASFTMSGLTSAVASTAQTLIVTARDSAGNIVPNYTGTVSLASSDPLSNLPATYTFTPADNGVHSFTVALKTAGTQSVTVKDSTNPSITGSIGGLVISPSAVTHFGISAPTTAATGKSFSVIVSALDVYGNLVPTYRGKIHFTDTLAAGLPSDYTFSAVDGGAHSLSLSLKTAGIQTLQITDTINSLLFGSFSINITAQSGGGGGGGKAA